MPDDVESEDGDRGAIAFEPTRQLDDISSDVTLADSSSAGTRRDAAPPIRVDRYLIIEHLGSGAMGVVYAAFDTELERKVAIKLLHSEREDVPTGDGEKRSSGRMLREAQAMAKLSHANVVQIYDVGTHQGRVFIAMQFVEGQTLREWMAVSTGVRPWAEVVECFLQAGRGLAAAHHVGLVHRDFKPDNVLIAARGQVQVMDFGLARHAGLGPDESGTGTTDLEGGMLATPLTQSGAMMGTPAYMAPEQFEGRKADARSDQFSFCVALAEALYGERPFAGKNVAALSFAITSGKVRSPPDDTEVPTWLREVVRRGLSSDPKQRYASMDALLAKLRRNPRRLKRRIALGVSLVALFSFGVWGAFAAKQTRLRSCRTAADRLEDVWGKKRKHDVEQAFLATDLPYAEDAWAELETELDAYNRDWLDMRNDACEATYLRDTQSQEALDRRIACLDGRLNELEALVDVFEVADAHVIEHANQAVAELRPVASCADGSKAVHGPVLMPDESIAGNVATMRATLLRAETLQHAGKFKQGLEIATEVRVEATTLDYPPLLGEALLREGALEAELGDYAAAEDDLRQAFWIGLANAHDVLMIDAAQAQASLIGVNQDRHAEGLEWLGHAEAGRKRLGLDDADRVRNQLRIRGDIFQSQGKFSQALDTYLEAAAIPVERAGRTADLTEAALAANLGIVLEDLGEYDRAEAEIERARSLWATRLGERHPVIASTMSHQGTIQWSRGNLDEAQARYEEALAIAEAAYGPDHPDVATYLDNLGGVLLDRGDYATARIHQERAVEIWEAALGPNHTETAGSLQNLAMTLDQLGERERAHELRIRVLDIQERALGPDHIDVAAAQEAVAHGLTDAERQEAKALHTQVLQSRERALGKQHPLVAYSLVSLGGIAIFDGDLPTAREHLERALAIREEALGPNSTAVASSLDDIGDLCLREGRTDEAHEHLERSIENYETAAAGSKTPDPDMAFPLQRLGRLEHAEGKHAQAVARFERALEIRVGEGTRPLDIAELQFDLAQALAQLGPEHQARGRELATTARATYSSLEEARDVLSEIDDFLR